MLSQHCHSATTPPNSKSCMKPWWCCGSQCFTIVYLTLDLLNSPICHLVLDSQATSSQLSPNTNWLLSGQFRFWGRWLHIENAFNFHQFYTEFHFLKIFMKLWVLCMICVATSDGNQHWKLQPKVLTLVLLGYSDFDHAHLSSSLQWSELSDQWNPLPPLVGAPFLALEEVCSLEKCSRLRKERNGPSYCKPKPIYSQPKQPPCARCVVCMLPFLPSILLFFSSARPFFKMNW